MTDRSPAFARLCEAALAHFAVAGYDGTSLSTIAGELGIRKASLYSHIAGKDALYLQVLADAVSAEQAFIRDCFADHPKDSLPGQAYLEALGARFRSSLHLQFLLRAAYLPPEAHRETISNAFICYADELSDLYRADFATLYPDRFNAEETTLFVEAWMGLVDAICVELLYGEADRVTLRKDAMMMLMGRALRP